MGSWSPSCTPRGPVSTPSGAAGIRDSIFGNAGGMPLVQLEGAGLGRTTDNLSVTSRRRNAETHLADTGQHVNGGSKVADVEDRQGELDIAIVAHTLRRFFTARQAWLALLVWALQPGQHHVKIFTDMHLIRPDTARGLRLTIRPSSGPSGAVVRIPSSLVRYRSAVVTSTSEIRTMSFGVNGWNWMCFLRETSAVDRGS
jgi:hypothetical protein